MRRRKETRLTIVNEYGRAIEYWDMEILESIQDDGKTLKLFVRKNIDKRDDWDKLIKESKE